MLPSTIIYPNNRTYPESILTTLVYDRTLEDVNARNILHDKIATGTATAEEIAEWDECNQKGAYNYTDLNRVGKALYLIQVLSAEIGKSITYTYSLKYDYTRTTEIQKSDIDHLIANVTTVKNAYAQWISTDVPTTIKTISGANAIEWLLAQVEPIIRGAKLGQNKICGDCYAGGD